MPIKKTAKLFGIGLDSDGHTRITTAEDFEARGGTQETHEKITEVMMKAREKLAKKGETFASASQERLEEVLGEFGFRRR